LVSASSMESFGMALFEARALGVPILALSGGNVRQHLDSYFGGRSYQSPEELGTALLTLMRTPDELRARLSLARTGSVNRTWDDAAREFAEGLGLQSSTL
jgi:glycosyltransferase involved in cell wall biosynthesis